MPSHQRAFLEGLDSYERRVLVCLQWPIHDPLPNHLAEAIRRSPPDWAWLFRPHPLTPEEAIARMDHSVQMVAIASAVLVVGALLVVGDIYYKTHRENINAWAAGWRSRLSGWE